MVKCIYIISQANIFHCERVDDTHGDAFVMKNNKWQSEGLSDATSENETWQIVEVERWLF